MLAAGGALTLAFPAPGLSPLAWICLAPLLVLARSADPRRGFRLGFVFGVAFFGGLLVWISIVGWVAWTLLVVLEALFIGVFGACWAVASRHSNVAVRVLLACALWIAVEYLRSIFPVGGFTWGQLAYSQHNLGWMLRPAGLAGAWGTALVIVAVNALVAETWVAMVERHRARAVFLLAAALGVIATPLLLPPNEASGAPVRVAVAQGNVPRGFDGSLYDKEIHIIRSHERLTEALAAARPDLVVWPESSVGIDPQQNAPAGRAIARAARAAGAEMVVGANLDAGPSKYKVVALQISRRGEIVDRYQKTHLVPFGEYVPARRWLDWIPLLDQVPADAIAGDDPGLFDVAGGVVAPVISFEGDFGPLVRERVGLGGRLLIVATNTSTWANSWASAQHVAASQVRAAETGVWVVHAALSGISAFIAPDGRVIETLPLWTRASMVRELRFAESITLYARTGDWLVAASLALSVIGVMVGVVRRRSARSTLPELHRAHG